MPPYDAASEHEVIARLLTGGDSAVTRIVAALEESAFYVDSNRQMFRAALDLYFADQLVSPESVAERLEGDSDKLRAWCRQANGHWTAYEKCEQRVLDCWRRRRFAQFCTESRDRAMDDAIDFGATMSEMGAFLDTPELTVSNTEPSPTLGQFLQRSTDRRWLAENFLERRDRMILTGAEGGGKSTLLRQWALQLACGVHPMTAAYVGDLRVMYVDCENSDQLAQESFRSLLRRASCDPPDSLRIEVRPQGLDLLSAADQRWLLARVAANRPDIIVGGPLYKMFEAPPEDEKAAKMMQRFFDRLRVRFDAALMLEAHSPHQHPGEKRPLRPIGSSIWLRWPEFGYGLRDTKTPGKVDFEQWRGPRDKRMFPDSLEWGRPGDWMWVPYRKDGWVNGS